MRDAVFHSSFRNLDETNVSVLNVRTAEGKVSRNSFVYLAIGSTWDSSGRTSHTLAYCEYHQGKTTGDILANLKRYDLVNCKNKCNRKVDATKCEHKKVCLSLTDCRKCIRIEVVKKRLD